MNDSGTPKERATELEFLRFFHENAGFGHAENLIRDFISEKFVEETNKLLPFGYSARYCQECGCEFDSGNMDYYCSGCKLED